MKVHDLGVDLKQEEDASGFLQVNLECDEDVDLL